MPGGRKRGTEKSGGRQKGSRNKAIVAREEGIAASGEMPVDFMLRVMRDRELDMRLRFEAGKAVAPYLHARRSPDPPPEDSSASIQIECIRRVIIRPGEAASGYPDSRGVRAALEAGEI